MEELTQTELLNINGGYNWDYAVDAVLCIAAVATLPEDAIAVGVIYGAAAAYNEYKFITS
ncbi:hypothetical protein ACETAC_05830 [Aceticella autotrophica]|uniref:Uncharacterized protein n=1 Tax=Aceticella autotrophica TaxID=2755338 RepID=A0A974Y2R0_9THEO|nr:hypothetical protein [Aceticella autotrophica]QSZ26451.1 hypothetical protein ACETAC_05830 [Aceticella autotrophica]